MEKKEEQVKVVIDRRGTSRPQMETKVIYHGDANDSIEHESARCIRTIMEALETKTNYNDLSDDDKMYVRSRVLDSVNQFKRVSKIHLNNSRT